MKSLMRSLRRRMMNAARQLFVLPASNILARCLGPMEGNPAHDVFFRHGFHLLRRDFHVPIPDESEVTNDFWERRSDLVGLEMNSQLHSSFLNEVFPPYLEEFRAAFPVLNTNDPKQFHLINGSYMAIDAHVYYAFIRHFKPKRVIEIGAGNSTLLAGAACRQNLKETGKAVHLTAIEPFPSKVLKEGVPGLTQLIEAKVQDLDLKLFTSLEPSDILFIDSSHVLREGGDVQFEYLEILPRLAPGVLVHFHDISLPSAYPRVYLNQQLYWSEQYLLQAFLAFNSRFEIMWPGNYMIINHTEKVCEVFPEYHVMREYYPSSEPSAFWIRVRS